MSDAEILLYHTHTEESNSTVRNFYGEDAVENHFGDYTHVIQELPGDIDPVFVRTEHAQKKSREDSGSFYQDFEEEVIEQGGQLEYHDRHVTGTLGENQFSIIEGVEGTLNDQDSHVLFCGIPVDEEKTAWNLELDRNSEKSFYDFSEDVSWTGLPHWNIMSPSHEEKEEIIYEAERNDDIDVAVSHASGYGLANRYINGDLPLLQDSVDYNVSRIPELDWHVTLPYKLDGVGVLEDGTINDLRSGDLSVEKITDCNMVNHGFSTNSLIDTWNFGTTMAGPSLEIEDSYVNEFVDSVYGKPIFSRTEDEYREKSRRNIENATDVTAEELLENTVEV